MDLLLISGKKVPKLIEYKLGYKKLWSSDTGRSMTGENKGTLIGIFPKLEIKVGRLNEDEISTLLSLINVANANVTYYDPEYKKVTNVLEQMEVLRATSALPYSVATSFVLLNSSMALSHSFALYASLASFI